MLLDVLVELLFDDLPLRFCSALVAIARNDSSFFVVVVALDFAASKDALDKTKANTNT